MKITIHITKEVLEKTQLCPSAYPSKTITTQERYLLRTNCAISYAVREIFPGSETSNMYIYINNKEKNSIYLPIKAQRFIKTFDELLPDQRVSMTPFSFDIEVPEELINQIGISEVHRILSESKTLSLCDALN